MIDLKEEFAKAGTTEGVYHLSGGEIGYTYGYKEGGMFLLRYESGWYCEYLNNGVRPVAGIIRHKDGTEEEVPGGDKRNIVKFEPMSWEEAIKKYPDILGGFHP